MRAQSSPQLVGCLLVNPAEDSKESVRALVEEHGYKAARFNPYLWPEGASMFDENGQALYKAAGELGIAVGYMCFKARHLSSLSRMPLGSVIVPRHCVWFSSSPLLSLS